jgi:hypothetical protein
MEAIVIDSFFHGTGRAFLLKTGKYEIGVADVSMVAAITYSEPELLYLHKDAMRIPTFIKLSTDRGEIH